MNRARVLWLAATLALAASACRTSGLAFRQDSRVEILSPVNLGTVRVPLTVRWTVSDFSVTGPNRDASQDAGYFAVLVDIRPMPPGKSLRYFARDDETCLRTPGCPDKQYLNDRNVFPTTDTSFRVEGLADDRPRGRPSTKDMHDITIVLLNARGERIGESASSVRVFVDRHKDAT